MLQGVGSIAGAVGLVTAALIGGSTFRSWRRQQLLQRQIPLAERILTAVFEVGERLRDVRSPLSTGNESNAARATLEENGYNLNVLTDGERRNFVYAQVIHDRMNRHNEAWIELQSCKATAYAYFGRDIPEYINGILFVIQEMRIAADELAQDNGSDKEFSRQLRLQVSSSRPKEQKDEIAERVSQNTAKIEERLKPLLEESASQSQKILAEAVKAALGGTITLPIPWPISRLIP